ncbi:hypothetical protein SDC9_172048 [bioreactor metagenome]|uniref:Uncharacterized protein n=1 Tax=bioreactor metagenome TaxID=1076179 RepID=A0A645GER9_9ZZZZ
MLVSYLFIHTAVFVPNFAAVFIMRSISLIPDMEGSATIKTISTPLSDAMTGQPIPGEPSMMAMSLLACSVNWRLTAVTSLPEAPLPILSVAVEKT